MKSGKENSGNIMDPQPLRSQSFSEILVLSHQCDVFFAPYGKEVTFVEDTDPFHQTPAKIWISFECRDNAVH
jgi:hypothetical protein